MIHFDHGRPEQVILEAVPDSSLDMNTFSASGKESIGRFIVDPNQNTVTYSLAEGVAWDDVEVFVHGYVPRGWITDAPLVQISATERNGTWQYPEESEKNILAGLAYLSIRDKGDGSQRLRVQIEPTEIQSPQFEDFVTITAMAGACQGNITVFGVIENQPLNMEPAQVIIARSAARMREDGKREQELGCAVRVGGANVPGVGRVEIGMFGSNNPGQIVAMQETSDFPARMMLDVRKHYITPAGVFYRDKEEFVAEGIMSFPPFGIKFSPVQEIAPLYEERTGNVVGEIRLGWLVPLCYLDASNFPPKALPLFEERQT
ncbi:MAG TPA: hypothetical protein VHI13_18135 [Candidatus Kapabacteria bacterium]|nr:hypothetical protein [Candidatus Kapabacteria bacterium]